MLTRSYQAYENQPRILDQYDNLEQTQRGVRFSPSKKHNLEFQKVFIPRTKVFDLVTPTYFALLENLIPGSELMEQFLKDKEIIEKGVWVYYPQNNDLVKFSPQYWHKITLIMRNSTLLRDAKMELSFSQIRKKFDNAVIAIAGCSVGSNVAYAIAGDIRPNHIKLADYKEYNISNANRSRISYRGFGKNKARVVAENIHSHDPFMKISVFDEGVTAKNIKDFIAGNKRLKEPRADVVIEEIDDPETKILIRETARKHSVPVIMGTDIGSIAQVDINRFDKDQSMPLATCGTTDAELYKKQQIWKSDLASREKFLDFAFALIGKSYKLSPEFKKIVDRSEPDIFAGTPQLGSTALVVGGLVAEAAARLILEFSLPERIAINKITGESWREGKEI